MRVKYTERATSDLAAIIEYLQSRNPTAAKKTLTAIHNSVRVLGKHPLSGRSQDMVGLRNAVVLPFGYQIFYGVAEAASLVSIFSIQHPSQDRAYSDR